MPSKLSRVLLIDDSEADNFIHARHLRKLAIADEIVIRPHGAAGLEYLTTALDCGNHPCPELIFLDINMPIMNGWEFLDGYQLLPDHQRGIALIAMLSSAPGTGDHLIADRYSVIGGRASKPLTPATISETLQRHFPGVA